MRTASIIVESILVGHMHGTSFNRGCRKGNMKAAKFACDDFRIQMLPFKDIMKKAVNTEPLACLDCGSIGIDLAIEIGIS